jgi:hypothetical protein
MAGGGGVVVVVEGRVFAASETAAEVESRCFHKSSSAPAQAFLITCNSRHLLPRPDCSYARSYCSPFTPRIQQRARLDYLVSYLHRQPHVLSGLSVYTWLQPLTTG